MFVNGRDCSIVVKTAYREFDVPYCDETLREAVSLLVEEAAIEGNGVRGAVRKSSGVTGCVVTPLTIATAPCLLYLAFGFAGNLEFVSETRNLYRYHLSLLPMEDTERFDLTQDRGGQRRLFEGCRIKGFELRATRGQDIKLKLDIRGERPPAVYPCADTFGREYGERFSGDYITYKINGQEYQTIYGITLASKKEGGAKTELWVKRVLHTAPDLPQIIDEFSFTARLLSDGYEHRRFGAFRVTLKRLVLVSDETNVNSHDAVIGPLRFYAAGAVSAEVFESGEEA